MNKIFRVIWSQATQTWVAVSELTKAHKKQSSTNELATTGEAQSALFGKLFKLSTLSFAMFAGTQAYAAISMSTVANEVPDTTPTDLLKGITLNKQATENKNNPIPTKLDNGTQLTYIGADGSSKDVVAVGNVGKDGTVTYVQNPDSPWTSAVGKLSGDGTQVTSKEVADLLNIIRTQYVSINSNGGTNQYNTGAKTYSEATNAIAIGKDAVATDQGSIALGFGAKNERVVETGKTTASNPSELQRAMNAVSIGTNALTTYSGAIALGNNAQARGESSIVIGQNANTFSPWNSTTGRYDTAYRTILIGYNAQAANSNAMGIGTRSQAWSNDGLVIGRDSITNHTDAIVIGREAKSKGGLSQGAGTVTIGQGASAGSADNYRSSVAVGKQAYTGGSFGYTTNTYATYDEDTTDAQGIFHAKGSIRDSSTIDGANMSNDSTAIGSNAGTGYNFVDIVTTATKDSEGKDVAVGTVVKRHITRDSNGNPTGVEFYTTMGDDGKGNVTYAKVEASNVSSGYVGNMATSTDKSTEAVLKRAGFNTSGASISHTETNASTGASTANSKAFLKTDTVGGKASNGQTSLGAESRAVGNASVAVGARSIAGDNAVVIGSDNGTDAFGVNYKRILAADLNTYAANRDKDNQGLDMDLASSEPDSVLNTYQAQTGRKLANWNKDSSSYSVTGSTVVGSRAHSGAEIGVAVGINSSVAKGALGSVALGPVATVEPNSIGAMALGMGAMVQAAANSAIAMGTGSRVISENNSQSQGAIAIGQKAVVDKAKAVALGADSSTVGSSATLETTGTITQTLANGVIETLTYSGFKGVPGVGTATAEATEANSGYMVSVGDKATHTNRQIKNVAAGKVSDDSTDAINGSQLFAVAKFVAQGWDVTGNDTATVVETIKPTDKVSFVNGTGTTSSVEKSGTTDAKVTFNVNTGEIKQDATTGVVSADEGNIYPTAQNVANIIEANRIKYFSVKSDEAGNKLNDGAKGTNSIAIGPNASVSADYDEEVTTKADDGSESKSTVHRLNSGIALGLGSSVTGMNGIAVGQNVSAATSSIAIGEGAQSTVAESIAIGKNAKATRYEKATAVGMNANANNMAATAIGLGTEASGLGAVAIGTTAGTTSQLGGQEEGAKGTVASGQFATAVGAGASAAGFNAFAGGYLANASATYGLALGNGANAASAGGTAIGLNAWTKPTSTVGIAIGNTATAESLHGIALGSRSYANVEGGQKGIDMAQTRTNRYASLTDETATNRVRTSTAEMGAVSIGANQEFEVYDSNTGKVKVDKNGNPEKSAAITRQLINLAAGTQDTDAVNVAQLRSVSLQVGGDQTVAGKKADGTATDTTGKPDLLLETGRFDVLGDSSTFVSTEAKQDGLNAVVTIKNTVAKIGTVAQDGSVTTTNGKVTAPDTDGLATAQNVANAINASGWNVGDKDKTKVDTINPGEQVNFVNGNATTTSVDKDGTTGNVNVKVNVTTGNGLEVSGDAITVKAGDGIKVDADKGVSVDAGSITNNDDGSVQTPEQKALADAQTAYDAAKKASDAAPDDQDLKAKADEAKTKLDEAQTAVTNAGNQVATAQNVADMINKSGFTLKTSAVKDEGTNATEGDLKDKGELINPSDTVEMVAGKNLTVKQEANGKVTYSLDKELKDLTSANFNKADDKAAPSTTVNNNGITITTPSTTEGGQPSTVTLNKDGLNNGGNAITNVKSNLPNTQNNTETEEGKNNATKSQAAPNNVATIVNNAATVGDVLNAGWNLQGNGNSVDFVKPYDTVNFADGNGTTVSVESDAKNEVNTVKYNVKAANSTLNVDGNGVSVNTGDVTANEETGAVTGPVTDALTQAVTKAEGDLKTAQDNLANNPDDADLQKAVKDAQDALTAAQNAVTNAGNQIATAQNVADAISKSGFTLKTSGNTETAEKSEVINPGDTVDMVAGKNLTVRQDDNGKVTYATKDDVDFNSVNIGKPSETTYTDADGNALTKVGDEYYKTSDLVDGKPKDDQVKPVDASTVKTNTSPAPVNMTTKAATPASNNSTDNAPTTALDISSGGKPTQITGVGSSLNANAVTTRPDGNETAEANRPKLVDLVGTKEAPVNSNAVATVGDLQNMGWLVSSDKTTGALDKGYSDVVKNSNEVRFVGTNLATVSGKTEGNVRTITVNVNAQNTSNTAIKPVEYTTADGTKVYPIADENGNVTYHTTPDGQGAGDTTVPNDQVITSINGPKGTTSPTTLANVKSNLPNVSDANKNATDVDGNEIAKTNAKAPITAADAANYLAPTIKNDKGEDVANPNFRGNNAATVSDVLNAGWNLQGNGNAVDFVKPYDTVNFRDGGNTTITTETDGTTSHIQVNVTGLPVSNTVTGTDGKEIPLVKVGDNYYPVNADGTPNIQKDAAGNPTNGYVLADDGKYYPAGDVEFGKEGDTTTIKPKADKAPVTVNTNLVNPNAPKGGDQVNNATQLGNVANGANTFEAPKAGENALKLANDGKWYNAGDVNANGTIVENAKPVTITNPGTAGLIDFSKSNPNNAATVGDLQNMGWVVSSDKTTGNLGAAYNDQVRNTNEVRFVGTNLATVSGLTVDGVRMITVDVNAQNTSNTAIKPVEYTTADGTKVYPIADENGNVTYHTTPDGKGEGDKVIDSGDVITSINGPAGTTSPTTLANVGSNLKQVVDPSKNADGSDRAPSVNNPDGTATGNTVTNKAPYTAAEAANLLQPYELNEDGSPKRDEQGNPIRNANYVGNNAATVSDVLNAGWNLQNNGDARDYVKPYDTVNFVNGKGTKAVVTTNAEGTSSDVTFDIDNADVTANPNGSVTTDAQKALKAAKDAQAALKADATDAEKAAAQKAVDDAQANYDAARNQVATAQNVADAINNSGFTLKTSANGGAKDTASTGDEVINPGDTVDMAAGKNLTVKQEANGKVTYALDNTLTDLNSAEFKKAGDNTAPTTKVDNNGITITPAGEGKAPVSLTENGLNNGGNQVTNVANGANTFAAPKDAQGNNLVKANDGKWYKAGDVNANGSTVANATPATPVANTDPRAGLVDFANSKANNAATVGDLQNMGWVISASDNKYNDQVRNTNKVDFKGGNGIEVKGETTADGTRQISVAIKEGTVTNDVTITKNGSNTPINAVKDGNQYYEKGADGKPDLSKPITIENGDVVNNAGSGFVTGNTVATAISESGWNVGLADQTKADAAFGDASKALTADKLEKVNPDDNVRFANGKNTSVKAATVDEVNANGQKVTNTYVKVDVDLPMSQISAVDANGNRVAKAADGNWYPVKDGRVDTTQTAVDPTTVRQSASMDPDNLGDKYVSTTTREQGLTPAQLGELVGKQTVAADKAADNVARLLQGQPEAVVTAAKDAAKKAAEDEVKAQYLRDNNLDSGTGGTVISNVAWGRAPSDAVNVDQLQNSGWNVDSRQVEGSNGKVISGNTAPTKVKMDETVNVDAGNNIEITRNGRDIAIATSMDPTFNTVKIGSGDNPVNLSNANGALSVGGAKITNVAPGEISPESSDAVNGAQIYALSRGDVPNVRNITVDGKTYTDVIVDDEGLPILKTYNVEGQKEILTNSVVEAIRNINEQGIKFFHSNDGVARPKAETENNYDSSASGKYATAIGSRSVAAGENAVAIGYGSKVSGNDSISIGTGNVVNGNNSGAFGDPSIINGNSSYSVGNNNTVETDNTFVLGNNVTSTASNSVFLGTQSGYVEGTSNADGSVNERTSTTAGRRALTQQVTGGVLNQYAGGREGEVVGVVSVGTVGVNAEGQQVQQTRRIQNVAPGLISDKSTDAINGSQLYSVTSGMNIRMGDLNNRINKVGKRADAGTASALATAQLPQAYIPGKSMVAAAAGSYQGQSGLAVGMSRISDNGKIIIKLSGTANTQGKTGVAAGIGYQW